MRIKETAIVIVFFAFAILNLIYCFDMPETTGLPSYRLTAQKTENGNKIRVDYLDDSGNNAFATDKHYATIIRTYEDGRVILEQYYDAEGNPAVQTLGHCALARHYNSDGRVEMIQYLDERGNLVTTTSGYNNAHRVYTDDLSYTDTYYVDDRQVQNNDGYFGLHRACDENKRVREITYLDQNGELTLHKNGYARITRTYNDAGQVAYEYFFDVSGSPVSVFSGYCGLYREYDEFGNTILTTYLDADGHPTNGSRGYASVARTKTYDGSTDTARYFNAEGEPVRIGRGQYGVKYVNGSSVYLDEYGEPILRIDNFLNNHPRIVFFAGMILTGAAGLLKRKNRFAFLIIYTLFIGLMTMGYRETGAPHGRFELFWSYRNFLASDAIRQEIISNIWLFIPLGAILYDPVHPHRWVWAACLSVLIETVQFGFGIGLCEIDDVISNSLGAMLGYNLSEEMFLLLHRRYALLEK